MTCEPVAANAADVETPTPPAPAGDVPVTLGQVALGFLLAGFGPYLVLLSDESKRPQADLVWLSSTFGVGLILAAVTGPVLLRFGAGRILRVATAGMLAGVVAMALFPALPLAGTGSVLVGLGAAAVVLVTPALVTGPTAAGRLTFINGVASAAGICAPIAFGAIEYLGPPGRWALLLMLVPLIVTALRPTMPTPVFAESGRPGSGPGYRFVTIGWLRIVLAVAAEFCFVVWAAARLRDTGAVAGSAAALAAAFVVGMAIGRILSPRIADRTWIVPAGSAVAVIGTAIVFAGDDPTIVTAGIAVAGMGLAALYPVTLAQLAAVPGLAPRHSSSLGALASGTAVLAAPHALALLDQAVGLRLAFLLPIPLLIVLTLLPFRDRRPSRSR